MPFSFSCIQCGAPIISRQKARPRKFCNLSCAGKYNMCIKRGDGRSVAYKSARYIFNGYVMVWDDSRGRFSMEHRLVMEQVLGRQLATNEHVHHKNHDRADNRPTNLELLHQIDHCLLHGKNGRWGIGFDCCQECHSTSSPHVSRGLCKACYLRNWRAGTLYRFAGTRCTNPAQSFAEPSLD